MWQRFTERARRTILFAQEEAGKMSAGQVETEHLLLGLLRDSEGVAARILQQAGIEQAEVRTRIEAQAEPSSAFAAEPRLTSRAKRVLELAADEARRMRHNYIGTEHLMLALAREQDGLAARILSELGLGVDKAREQVLNYLGTEQEARRVAPKPRNPEADDPTPAPHSDYASAVMLQWLLGHDSAATRMLAECGLDVAKARQAVAKFLEEREQ